MNRKRFKSRLKVSAICILLAQATLMGSINAKPASQDIYVAPYTEEETKNIKIEEKTQLKEEKTQVKEETNNAVENEGQGPAEELKSGPIFEDGKLRLYDEDGKVRSDNKWVEYKGKFYFPNDKGQLYNNCFIHFGSTSYYMDKDGSRAYGRREYQGKLYYLDTETGILHKDNAWIWTDEGWIFPNDLGHVYRNQFITFGPRLGYYVGDNGVPMKGMIEANGSVYRMTGRAGARLDQAGPYTYKGKEYCADEYGNPVRNKELSFGNNRYYYGADGSKQFTSFENDSHKYSINAENGRIENKEEKIKSVGEEAPMLYTLKQLRFNGVIRWSGYKFTYYSQSVLPGGGLRIPGRHVNESGYVADEDGYIVLANDAPRGTVIPTPFGYFGKVYDRGTSGNHFDVYTK